MRQAFLKLINILLYPIKRFPRLFVYAELLGLEIMVMSMLLPLGNNPFLAWLLPLFDGYMVCVLAVLLRKLYLHWVPVVAYSAICITDMFSAMFYGALINPHIVDLILGTNPQESGEFLGSILTHPATWWTATCIGLAVAVSLVLPYLWRRCSEKVQKGVLWFVLICTIWSGTRQTVAYYLLGKCMHAEDCAVLGDDNMMPQLNTSINRFFFGVAQHRAERRELQQLAQAIDISTVQDATYDCPLIVLIIGESYNKYHTPLYNDTCEMTTPRLCRLRDEGKLVPYTDVVTSSNLTANVMKHLFSTWDASETDSWTQHSLFPVVFREAGYRVYLCSNQYACNYNNDIWNAVGGTIFNAPGLSEKQFDWRNTHLCRYDMDLLEQLPPTDSLLQQPSLLIIHLMGQHVDYAERFPAEETHFMPEDMHPAFGGKKGKAIAADYANATLYNDRVVDSIWSRYRALDAVCIYLSDHGEEVFDWRNTYERTDEHQMSAGVAKYQFEVPMMFLLSDSFDEQHPALATTIRSNSHLPFLNTNLCHTLFHLGGIRTSEYKAELDLLSAAYDSTRHRYIADHYDYDQQ